jgi:PTH1 family peptidyl-tRNA hydrolase
MDAANYVLCPFGEDEAASAVKAQANAADAVEMLISKGLAAAQQKYH